MEEQRLLGDNQELVEGETVRRRNVGHVSREAANTAGNLVSPRVHMSLLTQSSDCLPIGPAASGRSARGHFREELPDQRAIFAASLVRARSTISSRLVGRKRTRLNSSH